MHRWPNGNGRASAKIRLLKKVKLHLLQLLKYICLLKYIRPNCQVQQLSLLPSSQIRLTARSSCNSHVPPQRGPKFLCSLTALGNVCCSEMCYASLFSLFEELREVSFNKSCTRGKRFQTKRDKDPFLHISSELADVLASQSFKRIYFVGQLRHPRHRGIDIKRPFVLYRYKTPFCALLMFNGSLTAVCALSI